MSENINLSHQIGDLELGDALGAVNTGRKALLALSIPTEVEWQSTVVNRFNAALDEAAQSFQCTPKSSLVSRIINLDRANLITRWSETSIDSLGKTSHQRRIEPIEGWYFAHSLGGKIAELSKHHNVSIAALVGETNQRPNGNIDLSTIAARLAIFSELIARCEKGDEFTSNRRIADSSGIKNARMHTEDLLSIGVLDYTKTEPNQRYSLTEQPGVDIEKAIAGNVRTKPEVIQLRGLILECMSQAGDQSVTDVDNYVNRHEQHPGALYVRTLAQSSAITRLNRELKRFEREGVLVKQFETGAAFAVTTKGILLAHKYIEILRTHARIEDSELRSQARHYHESIVAGSGLAIWLAHCDYTNGKFKAPMPLKVKDALIAEIATEQPHTTHQITKKIGGRLSEDVVRKHMAKSKHFDMIGKDGPHKLWQKQV